MALDDMWAGLFGSIAQQGTDYMKRQADEEAEKRREERAARIEKVAEETWQRRFNQQQAAQVPQQRTDTQITDDGKKVDVSRQTRWNPDTQQHEWVEMGRAPHQAKREFRDGMWIDTEAGTATPDPAAQRAIIEQKRAERSPPTSDIDRKVANARALGASPDELKALVLGKGADGSPAAGFGDTSLTGDAYLKSLPAAQANMVRALSEGRQAFPTGAAMKSPYWQGMLTSVAQYDPSFEAANYGARSATRTDFAKGKMADNIRSLNTAIGHAGRLEELIGGTASHSFKPANMVQNFAKDMTGDPGPVQFKQTAEALASELTRVFRGAGGAEADVKRQLEHLDPNASEDQKRAVISNAVELLNSRLEAVGDQYAKGMGRIQDPLVLLDPKAAGTFKRLRGEPPDDAQAPPATAGVHYVYNPQTKRLEPVQ